jgi:hypothetical protein
LNTNKNVNIGIAGIGSTATLSVGSGGINTTGPANFLEPVTAITANTSISPTNSSGVYTVAPAGATLITLPAPVVGLTYTFIVTTAATGTNTLKWITNTGTVLLQGQDSIAAAGTGSPTVFQSLVSSSNISFNCNGTTTGGLIGTQVTFTCLSSTLWNVLSFNIGSGTLATSFANS